MVTTVPFRYEIPEGYTWNAPSVFQTVDDWELESTRVPVSLDEVVSYKGHLGDSSEMLLQALEAIEKLMRQVGKIYIYASMSYAVDTLNQDANRRRGKAQSFLGQAIAAVSFLEPEFIDIGKTRLLSLIDQNHNLSYLHHYVDNLFRKQANIRSQEVEELLGLLTDPFENISNTASMLTDADFTFKAAVTSDGQEIPVSQGSIDNLMIHPDRTVRKTGYESYTDTYLAFKNTLANNLLTSVKVNAFITGARRYPSTIEGILSKDNIPLAVYTNLIETFKKNLPTWHRYWSVRRRALGVKELHPYDIWAPISQSHPVVTYHQAVEWICEGLKPMGSAYVEQIRKACLEQRWVDVYPNKGKMQGAFSGGWMGTYPFIVMSYDNSMISLSTLAHELGHSMHSYLTWENQPFIYADYSTFLAEVASNFHQAMVRAYLFEMQKDSNFQIALIEEAMSNFHRYFFIMPTLACFELEVHQRTEKGEGMAADDLNRLMTDLFREGYGGEMVFEDERVGITWATFPHLYMDYYVFQYATGISAANALANRILSGKENAVDDYLGFLRAGNSAYPIDVLRIAGVDMTTPDAVDAAFSTLSDLVDRLDKLIS